STDARRSTDAQRRYDGAHRSRVRNRGLRHRLPRQPRSRRVDAPPRRPAFRPRSRSAPRNLFKPPRIRPLSRGASLVWLGHSLAKAIRRVQIPRTALLSMCGEVRGASPEGHSTGRGQGAAIAAQCRFLDAGNEKTTDALIGGLSIGRRRNGVLVMSKPRMAFVVALGIAAALLGVSAFSTPAAAANNVSFTLFGSRAGGWGLTNTTVTSPGPAL